MIVTITGIRDLAPESYADVELAIADLRDVDELRFGGALGVDSVALNAASELADCRLHVIVPFRVADQPAEAQRVIRRYATDTLELGLPQNKAAYLRRNDVMLAGLNDNNDAFFHPLRRADLVLAFTDGRTDGGTSYTIKKARELGIEVRIVPVIGTKARRNPQLEVPAAIAPIHAVLPYVSRWERQNDRASSTIRALKVGAAKPEDVAWLADHLIAYIESHAELADCGTIVPMPRRAPGKPSDLTMLAGMVAAVTGQSVMTDWLIRTMPPTRGETEHHQRAKYPAEEHERTMSVHVHPEWAQDGVILLDNVITKGGTMLGAQRAVFRDTDVAPLGLAVLYAAGMEPVQP